MTAKRNGAPPAGPAVSRQDNLDTASAAPNTRGDRSAAEVAAACRRMLAALARRAATGDDSAAVELVRLGGDARAMANDALIAAHRYGYSYADLGAFLGISRQAVAERVERAKRPTPGYL